MEKILVVAHDLPPLLNPQAIQVGRLLYNMPPGRKLYVVTSDDLSCKRDHEYYADIRKKFEDLIILKFKRTFFKKVLTRIFRLFFEIPDVFLYWHIRAYKEIVKKWGGEKFDGIVVFACPFSSSILGLLLKKRFGAKLINFFSDPWAENPHFGYKALAKKINLYLEDLVMNSSDKIVFASPEMMDMYRKQYSFITNKSYFLEHSYDPSLHAGTRPTAFDNRVILRHVGSFYKTRNAKYIIEALKNLKEKDINILNSISLEIIGDIPQGYSREHIDLARNYGVDGAINFSRNTSYSESLKMMGSADVLVLIDAPIEGSVYLPSKLIDYIGADRPILALTPKNSASAKVMSLSGGWVVEPDDIAGIEEALIDIINNYREGSLDKFKPRQAAKQYFIVSAIEARLAKILE